MLGVEGHAHNSSSSGVWGQPEHIFQEVSQPTTKYLRNICINSLRNSCNIFNYIDPSNSPQIHPYLLIHPTSCSLFVNPLRPICTTQILLGMVTVLETSWPTRVCTFKENQLTLTQQLSIAPQQEVGLPVHLYPPSPCWDFVWLEFVWGLVYAITINVSLYVQLPCCQPP